MTDRDTRTTHLFPHRRHTGRSTCSTPVARVTSYTRAATIPSPAPNLLCSRSQRKAHPAPASELELVRERDSCPRFLPLLPRGPATIEQARQPHIPSCGKLFSVSRLSGPSSVCPYMHGLACNPTKTLGLLMWVFCDLRWPLPPLSPLSAPKVHSKPRVYTVPAVCICMQFPIQL